ncbi:PREDICTED: uncharacterized protein LOC108621256 [Drosophila arizonae]|uniref:Uncharacterized protein LOC108621256 n=1 Tax=Drosophila arizonae TaxID=7263 RepID=A0ABM1Q3A9_DROAR|nr:PREDICTED: uncharacterized protein LOC108621256 [Drosophila arizonae]XP_017873945.1 PREDICTED: uncharacterized protein LOC108621256 [Drosophila arizonae]
MTQKRLRCNAIVLLILLYIGQKMRSSDASVQFHHESHENKYNLGEQIEQIETPKDQKLTVRLPSNTLLKYGAYKDVSILHFRVPLDTRVAYFSFKAFEESKSAFQRKCKVKDVSLHLKAKSFPVISPENITFPKYFLSSDERYKVYSLQFQSDQKRHRIDIPGPQLGSWFAIAFVSWTDPNNDRIEQQGLSASCETLLLAELSVSSFHSIIISNQQVAIGNITSMPVNNKQLNISSNRSSSNGMVTEHNSGNSKLLQESILTTEHAKKLQKERKEPDATSENITHTEPDTVEDRNTDSIKNNTNKKDGNLETNNEIIYKFYVPSDTDVATARLTFGEICMDCPDIGFHIQANAFPLIGSGPPSLAGNEYNYLHSTIIRPNQTEEISIKFNVQPNTWHYALLRFASAADKFLLNPHIGQGKAFSKTEYFSTAKEEAGQEVHEISYEIQIDFDPVESESASESNGTQFHSKTEDKSNWQPVHRRGMDFYPLLRQSYHEFFMFDFDLQPDINGTVPALLNLTALSPAAFAFELGEVHDIGGTLTFAVSMKPEVRIISELKLASPTMTPPSERGGILAEKLVGNLDDVEVLMGQEQQPSNNQSMQIIVCMHLGVPGVPTWPDKCRYGQRLLPASSIVNNTEIMGLTHVPFPESGLWFVTMGLFCHGAETARVTIIDSVKEFVRQHRDLLQEMRSPCACAGNATIYENCIGSKDCLASMNETETLKVKECMMDSKCTDNYSEMTRLFDVHHRSATEQRFALENCNTSVVFSISSSPCVAGRCGRFGRCYHYMSGGFVFSTCVCMKGYRGWDCTEDSQVPSSMSILMASLLLTLSNLLFIPSIYLAFRRRYYTESVIYFFAMFFSIFYHACDSGEDEYSFCLVKISVLQFCDFYCGLLAIWVTLIAMAHMPQQFVSLLNMFGAILLAFGTELNKQSLWVFLAPALTGICLISASWGLRCAKTRKWFPARRYLTIFMPLGLVLVMIGLVCYAFLQTKQNYHIVHSIWHMVMALSIMCLLPSQKSFIPKS